MIPVIPALFSAAFPLGTLRRSIEVSAATPDHAELELFLTLNGISIPGPFWQVEHSHAAEKVDLSGKYSCRDVPLAQT